MLSRATHTHNSSEFRCSCGKLLFKGDLVIGIIEVKCKRCGSIQTFHAVHEEVIDPKAFALLCDENGCILSASKSAAQTLGYDITSLLESHIDDISVRETGSTGIQFPMILRDAPQEVSEKIQYKKRDGTMLPTLTRCIRIHAAPQADVLLMVARGDVQDPLASTFLNGNGTETSYSRH